MEGSTQELRRVLSSPPSPNWPLTHHHHDRIAILHASLERLRNAGDEHHLFLRTLLEALSSSARGDDGGGDDNNNNGNSSNVVVDEELLFHCAVGLRHVTLLRWEHLRPSFRDCVRDLCLSAGLGLLPAANTTTTTTHHRPPLPLLLPRTVAMALLGCASSFWKRGWAEAARGRTPGDGSGEDARREEDDDHRQQSYLESLISNLFPAGGGGGGGGGGVRRLGGGAKTTRGANCSSF